MQKRFWIIGGFALLLLAAGTGAFFGMQTPAPRSVLGVAEVQTPTFSADALEKPMLVVVDRVNDKDSLRVVQEFAEQPTTILTVDTTTHEIDAVAISGNHEHIFYAEYSVSEDLTRLWDVSLVSGARELLGFTSRHRVTELLAENKRVLYAEGDRGDTWYALELDDQRITRLVDHARNFTSRDEGRAFAWLDVAGVRDRGEDALGDDAASPVAHPIHVAAMTLSSARVKSHGLGLSSVTLAELNDSELLLLEPSALTPDSATGMMSFSLNAATDRGESKHTVATLALTNREANSAQLWADPMTQQIIVILPERWIVIDGDEQQEFEVAAEVLGLHGSDEVLAWERENNRMIRVNLRFGVVVSISQNMLNEIKHAAWRE